MCTLRTPRNLILLTIALHILGIQAVGGFYTHAKLKGSQDRGVSVSSFYQFELAVGGVFCSLHPQSPLPITFNT